MSNYILSIDQGTTSSRALIFDESANPVGLGQLEFKQHFPANGWVEHDATEIWQTTLDSCRTAMKKADIAAESISCIGITNQRETTVVWNRETGKPIHNAIVWQDRRTSDYCEQLRQQGMQENIQEKTGLLIDPYFSATKLRWILDNVADARQQAEEGLLAFGTVDSYLLWQLTGGKSHRTDATNASRTMLFNINEQQWDDELLGLFEIPRTLLPEVMDCAAEFGASDNALLGAAIPITGIIGDQQAAAFGQGCFAEGMAKSTYGTGCFLLLNTGGHVVRSENRLLSTVAYRLGGETSYAIEGSIFMAGATMQWIRDSLHLIEHATDSEELARASSEELSVYLVPAFTGLGAPYWDPHARAALFGMTRDTGIKEIVTAALMSVCYQTRDLVDAIAADGAALQQLRVDGGMARNDYVLQKLADLLNCEVHRPVITETTALGAAYVAGLQAGLFEDLDQISIKWQLQHAFLPEKGLRWREQQYAGWLDAINRTRTGQ
ncbi:MAG: glycerol kinase GlpK [Gammaproteobacteria bacterium]|jgi:glycerol kinase|nr:glycerol kinase GlpK [Gammaproteobacteria bacterium]MDP6733499.1 glycerol kinase GlpK [Gammaproteobacteria bacterium]